MACAPAEEIRRAGASRSGTSAGAGVGVAGPTCARVAGGAAFGAAPTGSDGDVGNRSGAMLGDADASGRRSGRLGNLRLDF